MKRKIFFGLSIAIVASVIMFAGCDIFEGGDSGPQTYESLIIRAKTLNGDDVEIEISTNRTVPRMVLTPMSGDTYVLRVRGQETSRGTIVVNEDQDRITFYPVNGGEPFVTSYAIGDDLITLYEVPTGDGGVVIGSGGGNANAGPSEAEKFATALNSEYGVGTAAIIGDRVRLLMDTSLKKTLTIPNNVTLFVPLGVTLTVDGPALNADLDDPDDPVPNDSVNTIAGSGSWQIKGAGTLDVEGTLVVRNRALRAAKTIIHPGATYAVKYWVGNVSGNNKGFVTGDFDKILKLTSGTLEIAYEVVNPAVGLVYDAYTFTLKGAASLINEFKFADSSNTLRDNVVIETGAVLTLALGASGGTITSGGKVQVKSGGKIIFNPLRPPRAAATGDGSVEILQGGILEIADAPNSTMKVIGNTDEYMFKPGTGAIIEMKPKTYTAPDSSVVYLFKYIFWGGIITTRPQSNGSVWMDVEYTIKSGATLNIPAGSKAFVIGGFDGFMIAGLAAIDSNHPDKRQYGFGKITVEAASGLTIAGMLLLDGTGATLTVPNPISDITGYPDRIGALNMNGKTLVKDAEVGAGDLITGSPNDTLKGKATGWWGQ